ncbi:hypothetical protein EV196_102409 [Mariniflexile fucanivorans]|uniref:Heat induced stress protein YflT n=1 Tax=Mariniflexile fucanivorans TaxID=264023 RepID=A0A4R1RNN1_9FLAO|nr:hypothetical protein EV196_102409 [Mariniflexile fucanivorans]
MNTTKFSENRIDRVFHNVEQANAYYDDLIDLGYNNDNITVLMSKETKDKFYATNPHIEKTGDAALKGAGTGGLIGGAIGAVAGAVAAIGTSLLIPGLGLVIAGPLAAGFAGAGAGATGGAIIGALTNAGLSHDVATEYKDYIEKGKIIISVEPKNKSHHTTISSYGDVIYPIY